MDFACARPSSGAEGAPYPSAATDSGWRKTAGEVSFLKRRFGLSVDRVDLPTPQPWWTALSLFAPAASGERVLIQPPVYGLPPTILRAGAPCL